MLIFGLWCEDSPIVLTGKLSKLLFLTALLVFDCMDSLASRQAAAIDLFGVSTEGVEPPAPMVIDAF